MRRHRWAPVTLATLALITMLTAAIVGVVSGADAPDGDPPTDAGPVATVDLSTVTPAIAADYHYAADHAAHFAAIPCYCGCDRTVGHRHLADCYVSPSGAWDAHAAGCAVCGAETATVREQLANGASIVAVRDLIIDQYGTPPSLFTPGVQT
jgi:hypothetical protein